MLKLILRLTLARSPCRSPCKGAEANSGTVGTTHQTNPFDRTAHKWCFVSDTEQLWQARAHHRFALQAFVPYTNASSSNETARYLDSHLVHTGQFFNTDLLNTYVRHLHTSCLCTYRLCSSPCQHSIMHVFTAMSGHHIIQHRKLMNVCWMLMVTFPDASPACADGLASA